VSPTPEPHEDSGPIDLTPRRVGAAMAIAVVPHTHWDREWYDPFQTFRMKLVHLIDGLLDQMEQDSSYRHFLLDGQVAVIDDYLEIRPENEDRLRALASAGRLTIGPWYILMDEFLVSGETIVRNLQAGIRRGTAFGGVMEVGYLPDMFGHIAQMPQILREAGLDRAVVWRGVPSTVDRSAFDWTSPDGSEVRAEYLVAGYGNGAALPKDAKAVLRRLRSLVEEFEPFLRPGDPLLLMNGTDHLGPQPWLGTVVAEVNGMQDEFELSITSLPNYLDLAAVDGLPRVAGELRSGSRSNLLMGVGSNRVDVKQAAHRAERSLELLAEPLSALFLPAEAWPAPFLEVAWKLMIRNSAHDSICACSADEVVDAVLHRYAEAFHIGTGLTVEAVGAFTSSLAAPGVVALNPTSRPRGGTVEVVVTAAGEPGPDVQVVSERAGLPGSITLDGTTVKNMLGLIQGARLGDDTYVTDVSMSEDESGLDVSLVIGTEPRDGVPIEEVKRELYTRLTARPETEVRLALEQPPVRRILARQSPVAGFGWAPFEATPLSHPVRLLDDGGAGGSVTLGNGLVTVAVDGATGTFALNGLSGYGQLVDSGDHGDTYNYSPPLIDSVIDSPFAVTVVVGERGPVRGKVTITSVYTWPDRVDDPTKARVGSHEVEVTTTLELRAEEAAVRIHTEFVNPSRDHRVRVLLPLPEASDSSVAECAFAVVERGLTAEGRAEEAPTPTFPSRRFVSSGGLTVVHAGLLEYELVDIDRGTGSGPARASTLALTLLRATGMLSRLGMTTRPLTAGPMTPLEGPQMIGPIRVDYALRVGEVDPYRLVEEVHTDLITTTSFGGGDRPALGAAITVLGVEVSSIRRQAGLVEVRVFNPHPEPTLAEFPDRVGWLVDLRGEPLCPFEGSFELRAFGIATVRLDESRR
jgi:mannosylglycerate hydrolase